jgi:hypothetical protein
MSVGFVSGACAEFWLPLAILCVCGVAFVCEVYWLVAIVLCNFFGLALMASTLASSSSPLMTLMLSLLAYIAWPMLMALARVSSSPSSRQRSITSMCCDLITIASRIILSANWS